VQQSFRRGSIRFYPDRRSSPALLDVSPRACAAVFFSDAARSCRRFRGVLRVLAALVPGTSCLATAESAAVLLPSSPPLACAREGVFLFCGRRPDGSGATEARGLLLLLFFHRPERAGVLAGFLCRLSLRPPASAPDEPPTGLSARGQPLQRPAREPPPLRAQRRWTRHIQGLVQKEREELPPVAIVSSPFSCEDFFRHTHDRRRRSQLSFFPRPPGRRASFPAVGVGFLLNAE